METSSDEDTYDMVSDDDISWGSESYCKSGPKVELPADVFHTMCGHCSLSLLQANAKACGVLLQGKLTTPCLICRPYTAMQRRVNRITTHEPPLNFLEELQIDLAKLMPSIGGFNYLQVIIDVKTGFGYVDFAKSRAAVDVKPLYKRFHTRNVKGKFVTKILHSDGEGAFESNLFQAYLLRKEILHQCDPANMPQWRAKVETRIKWLKIRMAILLRQANFRTKELLQYWPWAAKCAMRLLNHLHSKKSASAAIQAGKRMLLPWNMPQFGVLASVLKTVRTTTEFTRKEVTMVFLDFDETVYDDQRKSAYFLNPETMAINRSCNFQLHNNEFYDWPLPDGDDEYLQFDIHDEDYIPTGGDTMSGDEYDTNYETENDSSVEIERVNLCTIESIVETPLMSYVPITTVATESVFLGKLSPISSSFIPCSFPTSAQYAPSHDQPYSLMSLYGHELVIEGLTNQLTASSSDCHKYGMPTAENMVTLSPASTCVLSPQTAENMVTLSPASTCVLLPQTAENMVMLSPASTCVLSPQTAENMVTLSPASTCVLSPQTTENTVTLSPASTCVLSPQTAENTVTLSPDSTCVLSNPHKHTDSTCVLSNPHKHPAEDVAPSLPNKRTKESNYYGGVAKFFLTNAHTNETQQLEEVFDEACVYLANCKIPAEFKDLLRTSPEELVMVQASMKQEYDSLRLNRSWNLVDRPEGVTVIGSKWVLGVKLDLNGGIDRYKARLVAQGFQQTYGVNFFETYAPVVGIITMRIVFALIAIHHLDFEIFDVETAFLNPDLKEKIYMEQPRGFTQGGKSKVLEMLKTVYGLCQASMEWNLLLTTFFCGELGLTQSELDECMFIAYSPDGRFVIVLVYVDDIIAAGNWTEKREDIRKQLWTRFRMRDVTHKNMILGLTYHYDKERGDFHLHQESYIKRMLERYTPAFQDVGITLYTHWTPAKHDTQEMVEEAMCEGGDPAVIFPYREAIGSALFLVMMTRPDIANTVRYLSRFVNNYSMIHVTCLATLFEYLKSTLTLGLRWTATTTPPAMINKLVAYSDASYADNPGTARSTNASVILLHGNAVMWKSCMMNFVVGSSTHSEYAAMSETIHLIEHARGILNFITRSNFELTPIITKDLQAKTNIEDATQSAEDHSVVLNVDNMAAIYIASKARGGNPKAKWINMRFHNVKEAVLRKSVVLQWCPTEEQRADMLTKFLRRPKHEANRKTIMSG
jgi:hypothetical protein